MFNKSTQERSLQKQNSIMTTKITVVITKTSCTKTLVYKDREFTEVWKKDKYGNFECKHPIASQLEDLFPELFGFASDIDIDEALSEIGDTDLIEFLNNLDNLEECGYEEEYDDEDEYQYEEDDYF